MKQPSWLQFSEAEMLANFDRRPFEIRHSLAEHPLLQLPRLVELLHFLSHDHVEFNSGNMPVSQDYLSMPKTGLSADETLRRIEESSSWMALKNVERDPEYRALLGECMAQLQPVTERIRPGMQHLEAFIFVSSPGSITPYHMDPEHNFLLQIRGTKQVTVFDGTDRRLLSEEALEIFHGGAHRNMHLIEDMAHTGVRFELHPGAGLHIPVTSPHYVRNGPSVSVSFSVTFRSARSIRDAFVYRFNSALRSRGVTPAPPGRNAVRDNAKALAMRINDRLRRLRTREG